MQKQPKSASCEIVCDLIMELCDMVALFYSLLLGLNCAILQEGLSFWRKHAPYTPRRI